MVSIYSPPDARLLNLSSGTLWACQYKGVGNLQVIDIKCIVAVVAIVPFPHHPIPDMLFIVEKMGLDIAELDGAIEELVEE